MRFRHLLFIFFQEVETLRSQLSDEKSRSSALGDKVAQLGQVVSTSQEALANEQKTADLLRDGKKVRKV